MTRSSPPWKPSSATCGRGRRRTGSGIRDPFRFGFPAIEEVPWSSVRSTDRFPGPGFDFRLGRGRSTDQDARGRGSGIQGSDPGSGSSSCSSSDSSLCSVRARRTGSRIPIRRPVKSTLGGWPCERSYLIPEAGIPGIERKRGASDSGNRIPGSRAPDPIPGHQKPSPALSRHPLVNITLIIRPTAKPQETSPVHNLRRPRATEDRLATGPPGARAAPAPTCYPEPDSHAADDRSLRHSRGRPAVPPGPPDPHVPPRAATRDGAPREAPRQGGQLGRLPRASSGRRSRRRPG